MSSVNSVFRFHNSPRKNIIKTDGIGKASPEDVKWMTEEILQRARKLGGKWAWVAIISQVDPIIDPVSQKLFAELHQKLETIGCVAITFVAGGAVAIKVQAQRHQKTAEGGKMIAEYFRTEEEALKWLEDFGL